MEEKEEEEEEDRLPPKKTDFRRQWQWSAMEARNLRFNRTSASYLYSARAQNAKCTHEKSVKERMNNYTVCIAYTAWPLALWLTRHSDPADENSEFSRGPAQMNIIYKYAWSHLGGVFLCVRGFFWEGKENIPSAMCPRWGEENRNYFKRAIFDENIFARGRFSCLLRKELPRPLPRKEVRKNEKCLFNG